jgi:hypothetical protein
VPASTALSMTWNAARTWAGSAPNGRRAGPGSRP